METQKQISTPDNLRRRILEIKSKLPSHYTSLVLQVEPSLKKQVHKIRRVVALQQTDERITIALEKLVQAFN